MKKIIISIAAILILLIQIGCAEEDHTYDEFAKCLTGKGAKMYGAYWCHNCQNQKAMFKDSFSLIKYIECDPNGENSQYLLCTQKGISGVPLWEFSDGASMEGTQKLETLSEKTGCVLPKE
jgi:hypothetical protein